MNGIIIQGCTTVAFALALQDAILLTPQLSFFALTHPFQELVPQQLPNLTISGNSSFSRAGLITPVDNESK